ncbi:GntR family transcriptional regulator [Devosia sp. A369]
MEHDKSPEGLEPSGRGKVQDRVLASLQYGLMSGLFVPGQIMSLRKLATSLGTSPMPVRESLSRLVAANALEELPNRSVRVPKLSERNLLELFELRRKVEGMAARIACDYVNDEFMAALHALNAVGRRAHEQGEMTEVLRANQQFHFTIYRQIGSDILLPLIEALWLRCGPTMYFSLNSPGLWNTASHVDILEALQNRDGASAEIAMARDVDKTGDYLIAQARAGSNSGPFADFSSMTAPFA